MCSLLPNSLPNQGFEVFFGVKIPTKSLFLFGSPGRIRTSDQPVNSRLLYH